MKTPKTLLIHPGTQHSKHLAIELYKRKLLYKYFTGFIIPENNLLIKIVFKIIPSRFKTKIRNRFIPIVPSKNINTSFFNEWKTVKALNKTNTNKEELFFNRNKIFQEQISKKFIKNADVLIGFDTSFWVIAEAGKRFHKKVILDQTTAEPISKAEILAEVATKYPDWKFDLQDRYKGYLVTDKKEYELADAIVVASTYTKNTLVTRNVQKDKIVVNPYGTDLNKFTPVKESIGTAKIKFLFVGAVSALKGIPLLLEAWQKVDKSKAELYIAGAINEQITTLIKDEPGVTILGSFSKDELPDVYRSCHVFVFPSYSEGFGQVILEALASGLPVITTENSGGKDLIDNNEEGFVIPAGNAEKLSNTINYFIDNCERIQEMAIKARKKSLNYSWNEYGSRWQKIINDVVNNDKVK